MVPISYNIRSLLVRKATTFSTLFGISLVVFILSSVLMLSSGIKKTLSGSGKSDHAIVLRKGSNNELSSSIETPMLSMILSATGVKKDADGKAMGIGELLVVITMNKVGSSGISNVQVRGIDEHSLAFHPELRIIQGRMPNPGTDEVIVGARILGRFEGLALNQSFPLRKNRPVHVVGVFEAGGSSFESEVWADIETARSSFGRQGIFSSVRVQLESADKFDAFQAVVAQDKRLGLEAIREDRYYEKLSEATTTFVNVLGISISIIFSLAAMIGAMITMYASIANRGKEIGTLRALGFSRFSILLSFLLETLFLALIGGLLGMGASLLLGFAKFSLMNFASWSEIVLTFTPTIKTLGTAFGFAFIVGILSGFLPALRAARIPPLRAMRE